MYEGRFAIMKKFAFVLFLLAVSVFSCFGQDDDYYSYSFLGGRTSESILKREGCTKISDDKWTCESTKNIDAYFTLKDYVIIMTGYGFHDISPELSHDDISDLLINSIENGHIKKFMKCHSANDGTVCETVAENMGNFSFPLTIYVTDREDVFCYLTQTNLERMQFYYFCSAVS